jgi:hypothetical protein
MEIRKGTLRQHLDNALTLAMTSPDRPQMMERSCFCGIDYIAVPFFGAGGFFIGAAIGSSIRYDDWRPALIR